MQSDNIYEVILHIRQTSGITAKQRLLRVYPDSEELQKALLYGMHPHWHYGIKANASIITGVGNDELNDHHFNMLDRMASGALSGYAAQRELRKALEELTYKSAQLLLCILNKNFRFGLGTKSINYVFPNLIPEHAIQLAKPIDYARVKYPVLVSPKLDGLRAIYKNGKFYSRLGNQFKGLSVLEAQVAAMGLRKDTQLDGELMVPGEHFNEISGAIRAFRETDKVTFNIFDIPSSTGPLRQRYAQVSNLLEQLQVHIVPHFIAYDDSDIQDLYQEAIRDGYEGIMVKDMGAHYENARTWSWMKVKPIHTEDLKVIGTFEGQGKYEGLCGGLIVDRGGVRVRVGSGLSDAQRNLWADDSSDILGATIEVAFQEVTPDGSLRHPRLKSVRGDK